MSDEENPEPPAVEYTDREKRISPDGTKVVMRSDAAEDAWNAWGCFCVVMVGGCWFDSAVVAEWPLLQKAEEPGEGRAVRISPDGNTFAVRTDAAEDGADAWGCFGVVQGGGYSAGAEVVDGWDPLVKAG